MKQQVILVLGGWLVLSAGIPQLAFGRATPVVTSVDDSVAFHLNIGHTNSINYTSGFSSSLKLLWSSPGYTYNLYLDPIVANQKVFVTERVETGTGPTSILHAFQLSDGRAVWTKPFKERIQTVAYDNGSIFVADAADHLLSLSAATGKAQWVVRLPKAFDTSTDPVVWNGHVFASGGPSTSDDSSVYSLDEQTGQLSWRGNVYSGTGDGSPTLDGAGGVYVAPPCNYYKLDAGTGEQLWHDQSYDCHGGGGFTPVYYKGHLLLQDVVLGNLTYVLNAKRGAPLGSYPAAWNVMPAVYTDRKGIVRAISIGGDQKGGPLVNWVVSEQSTKWTYNPRGPSPFGSSPVVINGIVFAGEQGGRIDALDADTGKLLTSWTVAMQPCDPPVGRGCYPTFSAGDGTLIVNGADQIYVYAPK